MDQTDRHLVQTDRHLGPKDRHLDQKDRHLDQKDRHLDQKDRHLDTSQRRQDRHKKSSLQKVKKDINEDTGMDIKCCSCLELKSRVSCHYLRSVSEDLVKKYCYQQDMAKSKDGQFYICLSCKAKIKSNQEPTRGLKEIYGLYEFPEGER